MPAAIDLRTIAPRARHALVFDQFEWALLGSSSAVWRVQLTRVGVKPIPVVTDSCCSGGACCG